MTSVFILQMAVGVLTIVLTLAVGRLVFPERVAFTGAMIAALLPILPFFEVQLLAETFTTALSMAAILFVLIPLSRRVKSANRYFLLAGFLLGLATLGRPNLLLLMVGILVWFFGVWRRSSGQSSITKSTLITFIVGFALALSPVTIHNLQQDEFVLVSANLGANLVAGNSDSADGMSPIPVGILWDDLLLSTRDAGFNKPGASSRYLAGEALQWASKNPGQTFRLLGKKVLLLLNAQEIRNNINPRWLAQNDGVFLLARWWPATWLMLPLALLGIIFWRSQNQGLGLLHWFLLTQVISVLPFFVNARFRLPLLPVLALFAAAGLAHLWQLKSSFAKQSIIRCATTFVLLLALVNIDWFSLQDDHWLARDYFNQGLIFSRTYAGRLPDQDLAEKQFKQSLQLNSQDVDANARLGAFISLQTQPLLSQGDHLEKSGKINQAAAVFKQVQGRLQESQKYLQKAVGLFPRSFRVWANLGNIQMWLGDITMFRVRQNMVDGHTDLARSLAMQSLHQYKQSIENNNRSLQINPRQQGCKQNISLTWKAIMKIPELDPSIVEIQAIFKERSQQNGSAQRPTR